MRESKQQDKTDNEVTIGETTYELHISYVQDANLIRIYVVDITERRRTEVKLQEKERLLSESQRLGHIGSWFYDITGPMEWSDEFYRLFGVSSDTVTPSAESLLSLIHPDDRPAMQAWIGAAFAGDKSRRIGISHHQARRYDPLYQRVWRSGV